MKKILIIYSLLVSILLIYVLNTTYETTFCSEKECITSKQKIFDYIIGRD